MKRSWFKEEQIIAIPARAWEPDGGRVPQARDLERHFLQVESKVRRGRRRQYIFCQ
jgi:hypothetical protein